MSAPSTGTDDKLMHDDRYLAACAVARAAGALARRHLENRAGLMVEQKGPQDPVSVADRAAEVLIVAELSAAFPGDGFLGEEGGGEAAERLWVIDPIDGTANYVRGIPGFCVSIAFVEAGRTELGVIYAPMDDELYAAARGRGARCNGESLSVSGCASIGQAMIGVGFAQRMPRPRFVRALDRLLAAGGEFRRMGSTALGLAYAAAGRLDGFWALQTNSWDCLAGLLLVEEAGGWANDFLAGGEGLLQRREALGCTPQLRAQLASLFSPE
jgi:myo-inositol-1(or 4)-monophosphatase